MAIERWPPVYDAAGLKAFISKLATGAAADLYKSFYAPSTEEGGLLCQGDVIQRTVGIPVIDDNAQPVAEGESNLWLVIGNSCDIERVGERERWTQIVPVEELSLSDPKVRLEETDARAYAYARHFYLPAWVGASQDKMRLADFTRPVALHKSAIRKFKVVARLDRGAWVLLHSCLVRFLARDDGRFDVPLEAAVVAKEQPQADKEPHLRAVPNPKDDAETAQLPPLAELSSDDGRQQDRRTLVRRAVDWLLSIWS